jgi:hypothetical protein
VIGATEILVDSRCNVVTVGGQDVEELGELVLAEFIGLGCAGLEEFALFVDQLKWWMRGEEGLMEGC